MLYGIFSRFCALYSLQHFFMKWKDHVLRNIVCSFNIKVAWIEARRKTCLESTGDFFVLNKMIKLLMLPRAYACFCMEHAMKRGGKKWSQGTFYGADVLGLASGQLADYRQPDAGGSLST